MPRLRGRWRELGPTRIGYRGLDAFGMAPASSRRGGGATYAWSVTWTEIADESALTALLGEPTELDEYCGPSYGGRLYAP